MKSLLNSWSALVFCLYAGSYAYGAVTYDGTGLQLDNCSEDRVLRKRADELSTLLPKTTKQNQTSWMDAFPQEKDMSFDEFNARQKVRKEYNTIYFMPLSTFTSQNREIIQKAADFLSIFYGLKVKVLEPVDTSELRKNSAGQINAPEVTDNFLLNHVHVDQGDKPIEVVGITDEDLYYEVGSERLNFVFGYTSGKKPGLVWSFNRFGNPEQNLKEVLQRAIKITTHEIGHRLGMPHAKANRCVMNGYNNLEDLDSSPLELYPEDAIKIWSSRCLDIGSRYKKLIEFAEKNPGVLDKEEAIWKKALKSLAQNVEDHRPLAGK